MSLSSETGFSEMCERIVLVVLPVTACALYSCLLLRILAWNLTPNQPNILDSTWRRLGVNVGAGDGVSESTGSTNWASGLIIVVVFCILIVIMTLLILLIFHMGWHKCLVYYFYLPSLTILALVTPAFLRGVLQSLNCFVPDIFTLLIVTWNFAALGMMAIFGLYAITPTCLQRFYLIHNSAILSVLVIHALPGWAPWLLLTFLVMWDLFAVLTPYGPLNLIILMAERRGVTEMPGLVYSTEISRQEPTDSLAAGPGEPSTTRSNLGGREDLAEVREVKQEAARENQVGEVAARGAAAVGVSDSASKETTQMTAASSKVSSSAWLGGRRAESAAATRIEPAQEAAGSSDKDETNNNNNNNNDGEDERTPGDWRDKSMIERGVSIGLGDFIFYSLLIGLTSKGRDRADFYTVLATLVAVLFGLVLTLITLALTKRALPALPISIGLGLSVAALALQFAAQLSNRLASRAIFI